jgi:hypothetical protein
LCAWISVKRKKKKPPGVCLKWILAQMHWNRKNNPIGTEEEFGKCVIGIELYDPGW